MQNMQEQKNEDDKNSSEPFIILKNVRKEMKKKQHIRKQSFQYPQTMKKTRKMTIELESVQALSGEQLSQKHSADYIEIEYQDNLNQPNNQQQILNISEVPQFKQEEQQIEIDEKLPFSCNEWELDKQSPYMKVFNGINVEIDELKLDE